MIQDSNTSIALREALIQQQEFISDMLESNEQAIQRLERERTRMSDRWAALELRVRELDRESNHE